MYEFGLKVRNKIMLRANFRHKKCYNTLMLIRKVRNVDKEMRCQLVLTEFHENKDSNYVQAELEPG